MDEGALHEGLRRMLDEFGVAIVNSLTNLIIY